MSFGGGFQFGNAGNQQQQQQQQQQPQPNAFGATGTGGFQFGSPAPTANPGSTFGSSSSFNFGSPQPQSTGFGSTGQQQATSLFGTQQPTQQPAPTAASSFGFGTPAPNTGFNFGQAAPAVSSTSFTGFGSPAASSPGFGFGSTTGGATSAFGAAPPNATLSSSTSGGSFMTVPATTTTSSLFGSGGTSAFNLGSGGGMFTSPNSGASAFGAVPTSATPSFGGFGTSSTTAAPSSFGFGGNAAATAPFGVQSTAAATTAPSLFGSPTPSAANTGLFNSAAASSPFNIAGTQQQQVQTVTSVAPTGFNMGQPTAATSAANASFGAPNTNSGFNFGKTTGGLSFGATPGVSAASSVTGAPLTTAPTAATTTGGFNFGGSSMFSATPVAPSAPGVPASTAALPNLFGTPTMQTSNVAVSSSATALPAFSLGGIPPTSAPTTTAFASPFATPAQTSAPQSFAPPAQQTISFGTPVSTAAAPTLPTTGFTFGTTTTPQPTAQAVAPISSAADITASAAPKPTTGFTTGASSVFGASVPKSTTTSASGGFTLGLQTSTAAAPSTVTAPTTATSILTAVSAATIPSLTTPSAATLTTSAVVTTQSTLPATTTSSQATALPESINFRKLEELINKWTLELEDQERIFLNQATQVNAWDRLLISNGDKIMQLNDAMERVKLDQEHLDQEMDFILAQQRELEELLEPLEKSVESLPNLSVHEHIDIERENTFELVENIDSQLKHMSRDLTEIIEHVNANTANQDTADPIYQIGKILNAHINTLQWIDENTVTLQKKLNDANLMLEVTKRTRE